MYIVHVYEIMYSIVLGVGVGLLGYVGLGRGGGVRLNASKF